MADAPPPIDDYEREYMGGSAPLARSRVANPWWLTGMAIVATAATMVTGIFALPETVVPLLVSLVPAFLSISLMFLRVTVTGTHLHIQYGPFGPKIPITSIVEAKVEEYDAASYGGWGIKRGNGGWAYSVPGAGGRGISIVYTVKGLPRRVFASSDRPAELLEAIERARTETAAAGFGYRVAALPARIVEDEFVEDESANESKEKSAHRG